MGNGHYRENRLFFPLLHHFYCTHYHLVLARIIKKITAWNISWFYTIFDYFSLQLAHLNMGHKYLDYQFIYRGLESQTSLKTTIIEARGEKLFEGDSKVYLDAVYYWTPVTNTIHPFYHTFTYLKCEKHFFVVNVVLFLCDFMIKLLRYK